MFSELTACSCPLGGQYLWGNPWPVTPRQVVELSEANQNLIFWEGGGIWKVSQ